MKYQHGKIGAGLIVLIAVLGIVGIVGSYFLSSYYGAKEYAVGAENVIKAEYSNMENILSSYSRKIADAVQVPAMYRDDMKDVMTSVMTARQGPEGSKAMFQWFQEHQINIDSSMYKKILQMIEAGRNKFENAQTKFIDTKRAYATVLENDLLFTQGWWIRVVGHPKINLDDYKLISSTHAKEAFETGVDDGLKLR